MARKQSRGEMATGRGHGRSRRSSSSSTAPTTLLHTQRTVHAHWHRDTCDTNSTDAAAASSSCSRESERVRGVSFAGGGGSRRDGRRDERDGFANGINYERPTCETKRPGTTGNDSHDNETTTPRDTHWARLASTEGGHATEAPSRVRNGCQRARDGSSRLPVPRRAEPSRLWGKMTRGGLWYVRRNSHTINVLLVPTCRALYLVSHPGTLTIMTM